MAHWKNPGLTRDNAWINCSFEEQILMTYQNYSMQALLLLLTFTLNDLGGTRTNPDAVELRQMSSFLWLSSCQKLTSGATCKGSKSSGCTRCFNMFQAARINQSSANPVDLLPEDHKNAR
jgi:hypothetical protein